jgi:hypothetical protein
MASTAHKRYFQIPGSVILDFLRVDVQEFFHASDDRDGSLHPEREELGERRRERERERDPGFIATTTPSAAGNLPRLVFAPRGRRCDAPLSNAIRGSISPYESRKLVSITFSDNEIFLFVAFNYAPRPPRRCIIMSTCVM